MTFETEAQKVGRKPQIIATITLDHCANTYGVSPCTATCTPGLECYNTNSTCQDLPNYAASTKDYKFSSQRSAPVASTAGAITYPAIKKAKAAPTQLTPGKGLGVIGLVNMTLEDFADNDIGTDPYYATRLYNALEQGTFFGKLVARNEFIEGRPLALSYYFNGQSITQNFVIDKFAKDSKGQVKITGRDPMQLTKAIKSQCPPTTSAALAGAITGTPATFSVKTNQGKNFLGGVATATKTASGSGYVANEIITLKGGSGGTVRGATCKIKVLTVSAGAIATFSIDTAGTGYLVGDALTQASTTGSGTGATFTVASLLAQYVRIGDEIIKATVSGDVFTVVTRGTWLTTSADHAIDEPVQQCAAWESVYIDQIIADLLITYAGVPASYIDAAAWAAERTVWMYDYALTNIISTPTDVSELIDQLCNEAQLNVWFDVYGAQIKFKTETPRLPGDATPPTYNDADDILRDSISVEMQTPDRISEIWIYYEKKAYINPQGKDPGANYYNAIVRADLTSEGALQYGSAQIKKIYCEWLSTDSQVGANASRILSRFRRTPAAVTFAVDPKDYAIKTGSHFFLLSETMQGPDGAPKLIEFEATSVSLDWDSQQIQIDGYQFRYEYYTRGALVNANAAPDYLSASDADKLRAYVCDSTTFKMSNGNEPYQVI